MYLVKTSLFCAGAERDGTARQGMNTKDPEPTAFTHNIPVAASVSTLCSPAANVVDPTWKAKGTRTLICEPFSQTVTAVSSTRLKSRTSCSFIMSSPGMYRILPDRCRQALRISIEAGMQEI